MNSKVQYRDEAVKLRHEGLSYGEIAGRIPVSKATLSGWLRGVTLKQEQVDEVVKRKTEKAAETRKATVVESRKKREERLMLDAEQLFEARKNDPRFIAGLASYWAQGYKHYPFVQMRTSDFDMARFMTKWFQMYLPHKRIMVKIIVPKGQENRSTEDFWIQFLGVSREMWGGVEVREQRRQSKSVFNGVVSISVSGKNALFYLRSWQRCIIRYYSATLPW